MTSFNQVTPYTQPTQNLDNVPPTTPITDDHKEDKHEDYDSKTHHDKSTSTPKHEAPASDSLENTPKKGIRGTSVPAYPTFNPCLLGRQTIELRTWCTVIGGVQIVLCIWIIIFILIFRSFVLSSDGKTKVFADEAQSREGESNNASSRNSKRMGDAGNPVTINAPKKKGIEKSSSNTVYTFFLKHDVVRLRQLSSQSRTNDVETSSRQVSHEKSGHSHKKSNSDSDFIPAFYIGFTAMWIVSAVGGILMFVATVKLNLACCIAHSVMTLATTVVSIYVCYILFVNLKAYAWPFVFVFFIADGIYIYFVVCSIAFFLEIRAGFYDDEFQGLAEDVVIPIEHTEKDKYGNLVLKRQFRERKKNRNHKSAHSDHSGRHKIKKKITGMTTGARNFFSDRWKRAKRHFGQEQGQPARNANTHKNQNSPHNKPKHPGAHPNRPTHGAPVHPNAGGAHAGKAHEHEPDQTPPSRQGSLVSQQSTKLHTDERRHSNLSRTAVKQHQGGGGHKGTTSEASRTLDKKEHDAKKHRSSEDSSAQKHNNKKHKSDEDDDSEDSDKNRRPSGKSEG